MKVFRNKMFAMILMLTLICQSSSIVSVSASEVDIQESTQYNWINSEFLNDFTNWESGLYGSTGAKSGMAQYVRLTDYVDVVGGSAYDLNITGTNMKYTIAQLDAGNNVLCYCSYWDGARLVTEDATVKLGISINKNEDWSMSYNKFKSMFENDIITLSITEVTDYSNAIENIDYNNFGVWVSGKYVDDGNRANYSQAIRVDSKVTMSEGQYYSVNIGNDTHAMVIKQFSEDGTLLDSKTVFNKGEVVAWDGVDYALLFVTNPHAYTDKYSTFKTMFENGFTISINPITDYSTEISKTDLNNFSLYVSGARDDSGNIVSDVNSVALVYNKTVLVGREYSIHISDSTFAYKVIELDSNGNALNVLTLSDGDIYVPSEDTAEIALSLYQPNKWQMSLAKYSALFMNGFTASFELVPLPPQLSTTDDITMLYSMSDVQWIPGKMVNGEFYGDVENYVTADKYFMIDNLGYEVFSDNVDKHVVLNSYDSDLNWLGEIDLAYADYTKLPENTVYVTVTVYSYKEGKVSTESFEDLTEGLMLTFEDIEDWDTLNTKTEELSGELNFASLNNFYSWRPGYRVAWGGAYEYTTSSYITRNKYAVEYGVNYYVNINDSRAQITISEFRADGSYVYPPLSKSNGDMYTPSSSDVAYVTLTLSTKQWSAGVNMMLTNGIYINVGREFVDFTTPIVNFENFDLSDVNNWRSGTYSTTTGDYGVGNTTFCTKAFLDVTNINDSYWINLDNYDLKVAIYEFAEDGTYIASMESQAGKKWTKKDGTHHIAIVLTSNNKYNQSDFLESFAAGDKVGLTKYVPYKYNTVMKDMTADEFMDIMNVGWNLGNSLDSHYGEWDGEPTIGQETTWGNVTITEELIDHVADLGFNTIRIPVTWSYNTWRDEEGHLHIYEEWLQRVQEVVNFAIANDMYVFLNMHHEQSFIYCGVEDEAEFQQILSDAEDMWTDIAEYFKDYDEHLILEAYNEVDNILQSWSFGSLAAEQMNALNQVFVDTVRSSGGNNANRILMVPTLLDMYTSDFLKAFVLPTDTVEDKLLVQIHNYSDLFDQDVESIFKELESFSNNISTPIIVGECGTKASYSPAELRDECISNYIGRADAHGIKCVIWDDGNLNNFGYINRKDFSQSKHEILEGILNPTMYVSTEKHTYSAMKYFVWKTLNQSTGELKDDIYWGTIVTDIEGKGITVPDGSDYLTVVLNKSGEAAGQTIHYIHFYDSEGTFISAYNKSYGFSSKIIEVPENTKYVRVGINNSSKATKWPEFFELLESGQLSLTLSFIDLDSNNLLMPTDDCTLDYQIVYKNDVTGYAYHTDKSDNDILNSYMQSPDYWVSGYWSYWSYYSEAIFGYKENRLCLHEWKEVSDDGYTVVLSEGFKMNICELDADRNHIQTKSYVGGQDYIPTENTKYIGVTIYSEDEHCTTYTQYMDEFSNGLEVNLIVK